LISCHSYHWRLLVLVQPLAMFVETGDATTSGPRCLTFDSLGGDPKSARDLAKK